MKKVIILLIHTYQKYLSPMLGHNCRFHPTCSEYAKEAIEVHGVFKGGYLASFRIVKCGPWSKGGVDEVKR